jgi:hypothetical protein
MGTKVAERTNVLTESENKNFIHAVINAVTKGYSDNTVLEDILDLVRRKEVSKGVIKAAPDALKAYGESLKNSLVFLADQIENLEIIDEPTVRRKEVQNNEENVVEEEMKKVEETEKTASLEKFGNLTVQEDWDKYVYDDKANVMSGLLKINFGCDMNKFVVSDKVILNKNDVNELLQKIYGYYQKEYQNLKSNLSTEIFKSNIRFVSAEKGEAEVEYEIKGAF